MIQTFFRNILWDIQKKLNLCVDTNKEIKLAGYLISLDINDVIQRCIYHKEFEPDETEWVYNSLRAGNVFVDAGCNIGYYSLISSSIVGITGIVYSFDPSRYAHDKFTETIQRNKICNIRLYNIGLGDVITEKELFLDDSIGCNHSPSFCPTCGTNYLTIKAKSLGISNITTLDQFAADRGIKFIDLIKIDVEGYEPNILRGASKLLAQNKIHRILIEQSGDAMQNCEVDNLLKMCGFELEKSKLYRNRPDKILYGNFLYINKYI
jgi:FkbM family methyltransferase